MILIKELREALNVEVQSIGGLHNAYRPGSAEQEACFFPDWKSFLMVIDTGCYIAVIIERFYKTQLLQQLCLYPE